MAAIIPLDPDGETHFDQQVATLDGVLYLFEVRWNDREAAWYLDLKTADGDPILTSIKLVTACALGARRVDSRMPPGVLVIEDTAANTQGLEDPGLDDLGTRHRLIYYDESDFEETAED